VRKSTFSTARCGPVVPLLCFAFIALPSKTHIWSSHYNNKQLEAIEAS
jgi:hypothetical protein